MLEQQISRWKKDFQLYAEENLYIIDKDTNLVKFKFNRVQRKLWLLLLEQLQAGIPIRWLIVKDRQLGCSTWICGFLFWLTTMYPNKGSLQVNYDADSAEGLFSKIKLFYKMLQNDLKPMRKISNRREIYFANSDDEGELGLESRIRIDTADSEELGVSFTLCAAHLSEMGVWETKGFDIKKRMGALNQAIPLRAGTFIFNETTPRGEGYVSQMWENETNGYTKIFISSVGDEEYRKEISPSEYFALEDYSESVYGDETEEYDYYETEVINWYPEFDKDTPEGSQKINHEVMCRLAWRREMIIKQCEGDKLFFDREYPVNITKAFIGSGKNLFPVKYLKEIKAKLEQLPARFIRYRYDDKNDDFYENNGPLKVYLEPDSKFKYIFGVDGSRGIIGGDPSAIVCRRIPDLKLAFTFEDIIDPYNMSKVVLKLARIYNNAFVGLEDNDKGGFAVIEYLLNHWKYLNLYVREVWGVIGDPQTKKYGWSTNKHTKPTMIADLNEILKNRDLELLDIATITQLINYKELKNGLTGAIVGHDDLAIAEMICLQMTKYVSVSVEQPRQKKKYTLDWWASLTENTSEDTIGYNSRGSIN